MQNSIKDQLSFIYFGGNDWWYHNRAHMDMQLAKHFAKRGPTVYVNSIVMQKLNLSNRRDFMARLVRKTKSIFTGLKKTDAGFWVFSPFTLPVHHIPIASWFNQLLLRLQIQHIAHRIGAYNPIVLAAIPAACNTALKLEKRKLVYQRTDRFEEFIGIDVETITKFDRKLKAEADLTIFVSKKLYEEESSQCKNALFLDHGVDFDLFVSACQDPYRPADIANIPKPIIGYFGAIHWHTVNIELIEKVAELLPHISFVLIGAAMSDCSHLFGKKNIWLLGQKPYEQIPHYGKCFDVAIMPWQQNRWVEVCNPIKLKEYLALGKPIVSTPFSELQNYKDVVYEARTPEEFAERIKQALAENGSERIEARQRKVQTATWDNKAQLVLGELFGETREL